MKSTIEYKKQIAAKGFFAAITVEVEMVGEGEGKLECTLDTPFRAAIEAAYAYCSEGFSRRKGAAMAITVLDIRTMIVDSSFMVVMYVAIRAIFEAAGIMDHGVRINDEGELVLPK